MREQIQNLIKSNITAYRVAKDTNITLYSIQKLFNGKSKIDNITLKNAEILSNYWEGLDMTKEMEIIEVNGVEYYTFPADYYEDEQVAGKDGYYWDDELDRWTKEIVDDTTTIF